MKTLFLMLVTGPCLLAQAADPNDSKPTEKQIIVTTVKEAVKLPATNDTPNITLFEAADQTDKRLNVNTASNKAIKFLIAANAEAAQPTPFKDKIVRSSSLSCQPHGNLHFGKREADHLARQ